MAKEVFTFFEKYLTGYSSELFSKDLRGDLIRKQLAFTIPAFEKKPPGKYLLRYSGDLSAIQRYVMNGIIRFSIDILFLLFSFTVLALLVYVHYLRVNYRQDFHAHELLIFIMMMISVLPVFRRTMQVNLVWQAGNVSINKILRIFNNEMEDRDTSDEAKFETGDIEI